jgi:hypothetical protein
LAQYLWNETQQGWRPKDEESLSDLLKLHLERDIRNRGIVANREVQLRRRLATEPGEKTDILVDAVPLGGTDDGLGVVIEVKGCWNPALLTAMETQLVGRYLDEFTGRAGLYVVGWYDCPVWSRAKGNKCAHEGFDELERFLGAQARGLSDDTRRVSARVLDARMN